MAASSPVNLNSWRAESYPAVTGFGAGSWTVQGGGSSVFQSVNGQPTMFVGDFSTFGSKVTGQVMSSGGDDDHIGFALGYQYGDATNLSASYLLIDWKGGTQSFDFGAPSSSPGGIASAGLAVSQVFGIPDADEFWQHKNLAGTAALSGLVELQRGATLGSKGWVAGTSYEFTFDFGPQNLQVFVNGVKQLDITGSFQNGPMAFYNFSQANVTYSAFTVDEGSFPPPVPEPGSLALMLTGVAWMALRRFKAPR
jgi:hypothetical protein